MNKRIFESEAAFARREAAAAELEKAKAMIAGKKLWRVTAIEMKKTKEGGYVMGRQDHFTVSAYCEEMAVGMFVKDRSMQWFVTAVEEESVIS